MTSKATDEYLQARKTIADEQAKRNKKAHTMRGKGSTFTAIGKALGVTRQRAEQMVKLHQRKIDSH